MEPGEFLVRSMAAGLAFGLPGYILGTAGYSGRRIPRLVWIVSGALSGCVASIAVLAVYADVPVIVVCSAIVAGIGAAVFSVAGAANAALAKNR
jgi:peptidoglycan/LPS O-acetylase OafA/YrhL